MGDNCPRTDAEKLFDILKTAAGHGPLASNGVSFDDHSGEDVPRINAPVGTSGVVEVDGLRISFTRVQREFEIENFFRIHGPTQSLSRAVDGLVAVLKVPKEF